MFTVDDEDVVNKSFQEAEKEKLMNLQHAKGIPSGKTGFWYKLNDLIDKIKVYKDSFQGEVIKQKEKKGPPRKRSSIVHGSTGKYSIHLHTYTILYLFTIIC